MQGACKKTPFSGLEQPPLIAFYGKKANAPTVLGTDELLLSEFAGRFPSGLGSWSNAGVLVGAAATVTTLRFTLLRNWPEFRSEYVNEVS
eukprot:1152198-Pelagomonas_calceolata.AAC.5